jgi:hypothetical protein
MLIGHAGGNNFYVFARRAFPSTPAAPLYRGGQAPRRSNPHFYGEIASGKEQKRPRNDYIELSRVNCTLTI